MQKMMPNRNPAAGNARRMKKPVSNAKNIHQIKGPASKLNVANQSPIESR